MESNSSGLKDIPGVHGPIEDPFDRERKRLYADPVTNYPIFEFRSKLNFIPLLSSVYYYSVEYPVDLVHRFCNLFRVQKPRRYYHQKFRRVPNIWECPTNDVICIYEAESQFRRDLKVDEEILNILAHRVEVCKNREGVNAIVHCKEILELEKQVNAAWHVKYGDIGVHLCARTALQKQKNRLIEDRYLARMKKGAEDSS